MDTNRILMIDPATRKIEVPEKERIIGVYQDHDSERKYFKCPRIVGDNVDLSQHRIYINYVPSKINGTFNEEEEVGSYLCEDVATDGDYVTFSWKISDNVTREAGYIAFAVFAKKADADGNLETKWHTTPAIGNVLDTLPDGDQIVNRYPDVIEQIMERLDKIGEIYPDQIAGAVEEYMTAHPFEETDPTVPDWAKQPEKPSYTAEEVGADASGTAESKVSTHNTDADAHNDIRLLVEGLKNRLNALADSDDTTLDQMSEVVAYIKSNKSLIDAITTSKVNVSDIIDNLTTNVSNKPLSAAQGVALKALIDGITTVGLDETLTDNTKAAPAGMVGELKGELDKKIASPSTAEVGQTIIVKSVDSNGKPTEWEAADMISGERDWVEIASGTVGENVKIFEFTDLENYNELLFTGEIGVSSISSGAIVAMDGEYCFTSINNTYFVHPSHNKQVAILMKYLTRRRLLFCKGATLLNSPYNQDWSAATIITLPDSVAGDRANRLEIKLSASDAVIPSGSTYALYGRS